MLIIASASSNLNEQEDKVQNELKLTNDDIQAEAKIQRKRTIFSPKRYIRTRHIGIHPLGFKYILGYGPLHYNYVLKPAVIKPVKKHVLKPAVTYLKPVLHTQGWKPIVASKPLHLKPIIAVRPVHSHPPHVYSHTSIPVHTHIHGHPEKPIIVQTPVIADKPVLAVKPVIPASPTIPFQPSFPIHTALPVQPSIPVQPAIQIQPTIPAQPAIPIQPAVPVQPTVPLQPLPLTPNIPIISFPSTILKPLLSAPAVQSFLPQTPIITSNPTVLQPISPAQTIFPFVKPIFNPQLKPLHPLLNFGNNFLNNDGVVSVLPQQTIVKPLLPLPPVNPIPSDLIPLLPAKHNHIHPESHVHVNQGHVHIDNGYQVHDDLGNHVHLEQGPIQTEFHGLMSTHPGLNVHHESHIHPELPNVIRTEQQLHQDHVHPVHPAPQIPLYLPQHPNYKPGITLQPIVPGNSIQSEFSATFPKFPLVHT